MKQFHPDVLATVQAKALFSKAEESLLGAIPSVSYCEIYKDWDTQNSYSHFPKIEQLYFTME